MQGGHPDRYIPNEKRTAGKSRNIGSDLLRYPGPIVEILDVVLVMFDANMDVRWMNSRASQAFQLDVDNVVGRNWYDLFPAMRERADIHRRVLAGETVVSEDAAIPLPDGTAYFDVRYEPVREQDGTVVGLVGLGQEVTERTFLGREQHERTAELARVNASLENEIAERESVEDALSKQRQLLETIVDNIPVMLASYDDARHVLIVNKMCVDVLGWTPEDWQNRDLLSECYPDPDEYERVVKAVTEASGEWGDFRTKTRDGRFIDTSWCNVGLPGGGHVGIGQDITERRNHEREILRIDTMLKERVGRDLHDDLGQSLIGIGYMLEALRGKLAANTTTGEAEVAKIRELVTQAIGKIRTLARDIAPVGLDPDSLEPAFLELATHTTQIFEIPCSFTCADSMRVQSPEMAVHLYRITQEAINNAIKHSEASRIEIEFHRTKLRSALTITDDGVGIEHDGASDSGMGMRLMRYRANMIAASIHFEERQEGGTRVSVQFK